MYYMLKYVIFVLLLVCLTQAAYIHPGQPLKAAFMVSIRNKFNQHMCGGTLITTRSVITNAGCVNSANLTDILIIIGTNTLRQGYRFMPDVIGRNKTNENHVKRRRRHVKILNRIESNDINDMKSKDQYMSKVKESPEKVNVLEMNSYKKLSPSQIFSIANLYIHKDYDGKFFNNIAIIELDRKVTPINGASVIGVSDEPDKLQFGDTLTAYGWDKELLNRNPTHSISRIGFHLLHSNKCSKLFGSNFKNASELCLQGISHIPVKGFGGSPVIKDRILVGIVSYGTSHNLPFSPTVAINITHYLTFIQQVHENIHYRHSGFLIKVILIFKRVWKGVLQSFMMYFQWI